MAVKKDLNFSHTWVGPNNGKCGLESPNGSWGGQIGALQRREIDLSIMDLTILFERAQVTRKD